MFYLSNEVLSIDFVQEAAKMLEECLKSKKYLSIQPNSTPTRPSLGEQADIFLNSNFYIGIFKASQPKWMFDISFER